MVQFWKLASYFWFSGHFYVAWVHCIQQELNHISAQNLCQFFCINTLIMSFEVQHSRQSRGLTNCCECLWYTDGLQSIAKCDKLQKKITQKLGMPSIESFSHFVLLFPHYIKSLHYSHKVRLSQADRIWHFQTGGGLWGLGLWLCWWRRCKKPSFFGVLWFRPSQWEIEQTMMREVK